MTEIQKAEKVEAGKKRNRKVAIGLFCLIGIAMFAVMLLGAHPAAAAPVNPVSYDPGDAAPLPTPDVTLVEDAFTDSGFTFNAVWAYAAIAIAVLAPFAL